MSDKPRLVLHMGTHKTGTTTIQRALHRDRDRLAKLGVHYPDPEPLFGKAVAHHHQFARAVTRVDDERYPAAKAFVAHIGSRATAGDTVVISSESLYRHVHGKRSWKAIGDPEVVEDRRRRYLSRIMRLFSGFDLEVLLFVRRQDRFVESFYAEKILKHLEQESFVSWRETRVPFADYSSQIALLESVCPRVVVRRYEDAAGDVERVFYEHVGLPAPDVPARHRRSADARLLLWMRDARPGTWRQRRAFAASEEACSLFDDDEAPTMWESFDARLDFLRRFGGPYGHEFFAPPQDDAAPASLTPEDAARIQQVWDRWTRAAPATVQ
jgi:hypothetical protein